MGDRRRTGGAGGRSTESPIKKEHTGMKKLISLLLAAAMLAGVSAMALAVEPAEAAFEAAKT